LVFSIIFSHKRLPHFLAASYRITDAAVGEKISAKADLKTLNVSNPSRMPSLVNAPSDKVRVLYPPDLERFLAEIKAWRLISSLIIIISVYLFYVDTLYKFYLIAEENRVMKNSG
jgi:hypothetical protein